MSEHMNYPVRLNIKYNDKSNRITVFFRLFLAMPIAIILALLSGILIDSNDSNTILIGGGFLFLPIMLTIVIRKKYPKWWFDWVYELTKFSYRVSAYMMLLTDKYPSTDEDQDIELILEYPNVKEDLDCYLPLIKWFLAIPHLLILVITSVLVILLLPVVWLLVLIMGRMPKGLFDIIVDWHRYTLRIGAYAFLLTTDQYPSFNWKE